MRRRRNSGSRKLSQLRRHRRRPPPISPRSTTEPGGRQGAIEYYERSLLREETPLTLNNLAWLYAEEGVQLERALDLSLRAVKSDPENVVYLDTYAELLYLLGQGGRAVALMELALEMEPPGGEQHRYLIGQLEKFRGAAVVRVLPETPWQR